MDSLTSELVTSHCVTILRSLFVKSPSINLWVWNKTKKKRLVVAIFSLYNPNQHTQQILLSLHVALASNFCEIILRNVRISSNQHPTTSRAAPQIDCFRGEGGRPKHPTKHPRYHTQYSTESLKAEIITSRLLAFPFPSKDFSFHYRVTSCAHISACVPVSHSSRLKNSQSKYLRHVCPQRSFN